MSIFLAAIGLLAIESFESPVMRVAHTTAMPQSRTQLLMERSERRSAQRRREREEDRQVAEAAEKARVQAEAQAQAQIRAQEQARLEVHQALPPASSTTAETPTPVANTSPAQPQA